MESGWIKIHRKIQGWGWYSDSKMVHLFLHLLLEANQENRTWKGQEIKRGQLIFGRKKVSETLAISEQSLRTCMERLKSTNEITIESTNQFSLVTVVNYDDYQLNGKKSTSKSTSKSTNDQPTTNQQSTTPKEDILTVYQEVKNNSDFDFGNLGAAFSEKWKEWIRFKHSQFKQAYKTHESEQIAIRHLVNISGGSFLVASKIIDKSIGNIYKGLFPLNKEEEKPKSIPGQHPNFRP